MATDFDRGAFIGSLEEAVNQKGRAINLGTELARGDIKRVFFVACGAPNRQMATVKYWAERVAKHLEFRLYFPAEFINQDPATLDSQTLVILGSHSGTTPEVVQAAQFLQGKGTITVGITQKEDSPLAQAVDHALLYGESKSGYYASYILCQAFVGAILKERENWTLQDQLSSSLDALPAVLTDTIEASEARATEAARIYKDDRNIYLVGSGPCFSTAYVFGVCVLMEMQWIHGYPIEAAEFFHGPFEIVDQTTPLILLLGEDPSRPEAERVVRFCKKYTERLLIYDSTDYEMRGIAKDVRPIVAPFVLEAALSRIAEHLAVWHNHPLSTRRYMWKTEY